MTEENQKNSKPTRIAQIRDVLFWPDEALAKECKRVTEFDQELRNLAVDMLFTMKTLNGVGLAAPQIGVLKSLFVLQLEDDKPIVVINPSVTVIGDEMYEWDEGCLSVPGYFKKGKRPKNIALRFQDVDKNSHHVQFGGLYAFAILHEIDHLNGKCFVDSLSKLRHPFIRGKINKTKGAQNMRALRMKAHLQSDAGKQKQ